MLNTALDRTFGSGGRRVITMQVFDQPKYTITLMGARQLRRARLERFFWGTMAGLWSYYSLALAAGWGSFAGDSGWLLLLYIPSTMMFGLYCWLENRKLRIDDANRRHLEHMAYKLAEIGDVFAENMDERDRTLLRSTAIDWMEMSMDPTQWDRPWWRLRDPLRREN
jgi:hypothetical protein